MFFCLPIFFGCATKIKPDGTEQTPRTCPRCNNASIYAAKSTKWFELFWVPLVPFSKKHLWMCSICQFRAPMAEGQWEPPVATPGYFPPFNQTQQHQQSQSPANHGYNPTYLDQQQHQQKQ